MAQQKTERMDKKVRADMMGMLRERVENPTLRLDFEVAEMRVDPRLVAIGILVHANFLDRHGRITLAGMDYYRKETTNPILTWIRANWFAVIVAGCTIGVSVFGIVSG